MDAHSKWTEVFIVTITSTAAAIEKFRWTFATHGICIKQFMALDGHMTH
jgi:hypothetical protein